MASEQKESKFSRRMFKLAIIGLSVYLSVTFVGGQMRVLAKQRELDEAVVKVEKQKEKNEELISLMQSGDEDAYIERVAREKLGYVRPEESVFVDISGQ